jgi:hypothetical protein
VVVIGIVRWFGELGLDVGVGCTGLVETEVGRRGGSGMRV